MPENAQFNTQNVAGNRSPQQPNKPAPAENKPYPAENARSGEIILDTALKRGVFIAGLAGAVALALALSFLS